jgi:hypothetical protein
MKKNHEWDYVDLNFKGYANSVRTTDIKLSPPTPLPKDLIESQKNRVNETANSKTPTSSNLKSEN